MNNIKQTAADLYKSGYSCSEAVLKAADQAGLLPEGTNIDDLTKIATMFSGGMSSKCVCGAVAGAQIAAGVNFGRTKVDQSSSLARIVAKDIVDRFRQINNVTCCKALGGKISDTALRKEFCTNLVVQCAEILDTVISENSKEKV